MKLLFSMLLFICSSLSVAQMSERDELAGAALEALLVAPPQIALSRVKGVLEGDHSNHVKRRSLFVLSQIGLPEARALLADFAQSSSPLQGEAIRMVGIGGDKAALAQLADVYASGSSEIKKQVLQAYLIADDEDAVFEAASTATSTDDFDAAVHVLGAMGAIDKLRQLPATSESVIHAYAIAGDLTQLLAIARSTDEDVTPQMRAKAVRSLGIVGGDKARSALKDIYLETDDEEIRKSAAQGLMMSNGDEQLIELYRATDSLKGKTHILRMLSSMNSDAALEIIDSALSGQQP